MKRAFLLAAVVFLATPAMAYDPGEAYEALGDLTPACETGTYADEAPASPKERLEACQRVVELQQELSQNGYCFNSDGWTACQ